MLLQGTHENCRKILLLLSAGTIHTPAWQTYLSVWGRKRVRLDSDESDNGRGNTITSTELFLLGLFFLRANDTYFFIGPSLLGQIWEVGCMYLKILELVFRLKKNASFLSGMLTLILHQGVICMSTDPHPCPRCLHHPLCATHSCLNWFLSSSVISGFPNSLILLLCLHYLFTNLIS